MKMHYTYTVDTQVRMRIPTTETYLYDIAVWRITEGVERMLPPYFIDKIQFCGTPEAAHTAAQTFLDLMKIREER